MHRSTFTAREKVALSAWLCAGIIWIITGVTDVSEFGIWTVLAAYSGVAAIFGSVAALVHHRDR